MTVGAINHLWWEFLARHHNDPEAVEARRIEHEDQARLVCRAVPCGTCFAEAGQPCVLERGFHFDRGLRYARTGGA